MNVNHKEHEGHKETKCLLEGATNSFFVPFVVKYHPFAPSRLCVRSFLMVGISFLVIHL